MVTLPEPGNDQIDIYDAMSDWDRELFDQTGWIPGEWARAWKGKKIALANQRDNILVPAIRLIMGDEEPPYWFKGQIDDFAVDLYRQTELAFKSLISLDSVIDGNPKRIAKIPIRERHEIHTLYHELTDLMKELLQYCWDAIPPSIEIEDSEKTLDAVIDGMKGVYLPQKYDMYEKTTRRVGIPPLSWTWVCMIVGSLATAQYHVRDNVRQLKKYGVPGRGQIDIPIRKDIPQDVVFSRGPVMGIVSTTWFDTPMGTAILRGEY